MNQLLKAKIEAIEESLNALMQRLNEINTAYHEMPPQAQATLSLDHETLNQLPWTPFTNSNGAWIFSDKVPELKKALMNQGAVEIGPFRYKLSGDQNKFIARFPT